MSEDLLILVDENNHEIGHESKLKTHQLGLLHRAFSIYIFRQNEAGEIELLLQKRAMNKYHSGGLWTNTCCSHPRKGESLEIATQRRLKEELGFTCPVDYVSAFIYKATVGDLTEHEYDHVFVGYYDDQTITPNPDEIECYQWLSLTQIDSELSKTPDLYTAWFKESYMIAKNQCSDHYAPNRHSE
jgi:isopentenyl-diphosphate delta-isomerase